MSGPPPPPRKKRQQSQPGSDSKDIVEYTAKLVGKASQVKKYEIPELDKIPETSIGKGVRMRGELHFDRLLRIDGSFVGNLHSTGNVIVGETGYFKGDMLDLKTILVDGGKIEGNLRVESVIAINSASIIGSITCKTISCDRNVTLRGRLNIHQLAPELIDSMGEIVLDQEELAGSRRAAAALLNEDIDHFTLDDVVLPPSLVNGTANDNIAEDSALQSTQHPALETAPATTGIYASSGPTSNSSISPELLTSPAPHNIPSSVDSPPKQGSKSVEPSIKLAEADSEESAVSQSKIVKENITAPTAISSVDKDAVESKEIDNPSESQALESKASDS